MDIAIGVRRAARSTNFGLPAPNCAVFRSGRFPPNARSSGLLFGQTGAHGEICPRQIERGGIVGTRFFGHFLKTRKRPCGPASRARRRAAEGLVRRPAKQGPQARTGPIIRRRRARKAYGAFKQEFGARIRGASAFWPIFLEFRASSSLAAAFCKCCKASAPAGPGGATPAVGVEPHNRVITGGRDPCPPSARRANARDIARRRGWAATSRFPRCPADEFPAQQHGVLWRWILGPESRHRPGRNYPSARGPVSAGDDELHLASHVLARDGLVASARCMGGAATRISERPADYAISAPRTGWSRGEQQARAQSPLSTSSNPPRAAISTPTTARSKSARQRRAARSTPPIGGLDHQGQFRPGPRKCPGPDRSGISSAHQPRARQKGCGRPRSRAGAIDPRGRTAPRRIPLRARRTSRPVQKNPPSSTMVRI